MFLPQNARLATKAQRPESRSPEKTTTSRLETPSRCVTHVAGSSGVRPYRHTRPQHECRDYDCVVPARTAFSARRFSPPRRNAPDRRSPGRGATILAPRFDADRHGKPIRPRQGSHNDERPQHRASRATLLTPDPPRRNAPDRRSPGRGATIVAPRFNAGTDTENESDPGRGRTAFESPILLELQLEAVRMQLGLQEFYFAAVSLCCRVPLVDHPFNISAIDRLRVPVAGVISTKNPPSPSWGEGGFEIAGSSRRYFDRMMRL